MKFKVNDLVVGTDSENYYYGGMNMSSAKGIVVRVDEESYDVEFRLPNGRIIDYKMHEDDLLPYKEPSPKKLLII